MTELETFLLALVLVMAVLGGVLVRAVFKADTETAVALSRAEAAEAQLREGER